MPAELSQEQKLEIWRGHALTLYSVRPDVVAVTCKCGFTRRAPAWAAAADLGQAHLDSVSVALFGRPGGPPV